MPSTLLPSPIIDHRFLPRRLTTVTKTAGIVFFIAAALVLAIAISNFAGQFSAAGDIAGKGDLKTVTTTDLRWAMGVQFLIDMLVVGALVIVGWFLFGSETEQWAYVIATAVLLMGGLTIRLTPLVPMTAARVSPTVFFYGTQVELELTDDDTEFYTILPPSDRFRVGRLGQGAGEKQTEVLLDFRGDTELTQAYWKGPWPVTVIGSVSGTRTLIRPQERITFLVPRVRVFKVGAE